MLHVPQVIKDAEGGMWWKQVAKLYKEKYKKDIPDNAQAICAQTSSIEVDELVFQHSQLICSDN